MRKPEFLVQIKMMEECFAEEIERLRVSKMGRRYSTLGSNGGR